MIVGVPKEIKSDEYRVGLLPVGAELLTKDGHTVLIERDAGSASGFEDRRHSAVGAQIVETANEIYGRADLIVKVVAARRCLGPRRTATRPTASTASCVIA